MNLFDTLFKNGRNGLILVYDWPDYILGIAGVVGVIFLGWAISYASRRPRPRPAPVGDAAMAAGEATAS